MANKPEFVDLVSAATRQKYRRPKRSGASATGRPTTWNNGGWSI
jgi:hypothetical protein